MKDRERYRRHFGVEPPDDLGKFDVWHIHQTAADACGRQFDEPDVDTLVRGLARAEAAAELELEVDEE